MDQKIYIHVAWIVFVIVAALHLARLVLGLQITIDGWPLPFWVNGAGVIIALFLAYEGFRISHKS